MVSIYLASSSPQRKNLLRSHGFCFKTLRLRFAEQINPRLSPAQNAIRLALGKAKSVRLKSGVVIAADTLVALGSRILGKPKSRADARGMLELFSGKGQWVYTGVCLRDLKSEKTAVFSERSRVVFKKMGARDIERYLDSGEYRGKAGAFALQGKGSRFIESVRGSRTNIVGLPMEKLSRVLRKFMRASSYRRISAEGPRL